MKDVCSCMGEKVVPENKRGRFRCPTCKRRMIARHVRCHCGVGCHCVDYYVVPPHKPKGYYKKKKLN